MLVSQVELVSVPFSLSQDSGVYFNTLDNLPIVNINYTISVALHTLYIGLGKWTVLQL